MPGFGLQRRLGGTWILRRSSHLCRRDNALTVADFDVPVRGLVSHGLSCCLMDDARYRPGRTVIRCRYRPALSVSRHPFAARPASAPNWGVLGPARGRAMAPSHIATR